MTATRILVVEDEQIVAEDLKMTDRKSSRLTSSHGKLARMPSSA